MGIRILLIVLAFCTALAQSASAAYPEQPIRLVIAFPPGGTTDVIARAIADPLGKELGQPVIVDYKPGADGVIAADAVARAAPDGYTLLLGQANAFSYAPWVHASMPYDAARDFTPVSGIGTVGFFVYVRDSVPANTMPQLIEYLRKNGNSVNHGASTPMSLLASTMFARQEHVNFVQVPYKGDAPLLGDMLGGRVQLAFAAGGLLPQAAPGGKLRVLATLAPTRSAVLPDVPTLKESGAEDVAIRAWTGILGPAGLPAATTQQLARAVSNVLKRQQVRAQLAALAFDVEYSGPAALASTLRQQALEWKRAIDTAGVAHH